MAYSHKTQSFRKNGGQQKCLDKALGGFGYSFLCSRYLHSYPKLVDCQQITFVMLNRFYLLSKTPVSSLSPLFLTDNVEMDRMPTKIKWKIHFPSILHLKFWSYIHLIKIFKIQPPDLLFVVASISFLRQQIPFFTNF